MDRKQAQARLDRIRDTPARNWRERRQKARVIAQARAAIEQASTRGDARQYVGAMIRGVRAGAKGNAFAALRQRLADNQQEGETRT